MNKLNGIFENQQKSDWHLKREPFSPFSKGLKFNLGPQFAKGPIPHEMSEWYA